MQPKIRRRGLRRLHRHGIEQLPRTCARPPLSQERLGRLNDTTLQLLEQARASMGLPSAQAPPPAEPGEPPPKADFRRAAVRCWALLLVRIYECLPPRCAKCGEPMRIIAFGLDRPTIERILDHIGDRAQPPVVVPVRSPPQGEFWFDQAIATLDWPEMDQVAGQDGGWEWTPWVD